MSRLLYCIGINLLLSIQQISTEECSALSSYVQVTAPSLQTVLSAHSLFPPYTYDVNSTELVTLDSTRDNICSGILSTDITNKIVLIMPDDGNCSYVERVYGAEINDAKAVILSSDDYESGSVESIIDDNTVDDDGNVIETSIPVRIIPYNSASSLQSMY